MAANAAMTSSSNRRVLPQWIRSLHIWLSMIGFGATLLFAVTGFTLNHVEWFEKAEPVVTTSQGALPLPLLAGDVDRLGVAEELRASHRLRVLLTRVVASPPFFCAGEVSVRVRLVARAREPLARHPHNR